MSRYASVVINLGQEAEKEVFYYLIPTDLIHKASIGTRVMVPFNNQKREGFVIDLPQIIDAIDLKTIDRIIDAEPIISEELVALALWVSKKYLCSIYKVLEYIIPPYARGQTIQWVRLLVPAQELKAQCILDSQLAMIISLLKDRPQKLSMLLNKLGKNYQSKIMNLEKRRIVEFFYEYETKGKPKYLTFLKANIQKEELWKTLDSLKRAPKQQEIIRYLVENGAEGQIDICRKLHTSLRPIVELEQKGLLRRIKVEEKRKPYLDITFQQTKKIILNPDQENVLREIEKQLDDRGPSTVLLHGVTGSGKTEVYIRAVNRALQLGKGALVLVPEISLTPQIIGRFSAALGENVVVLHSALSQGERLDAWNNLRKGLARVVVGVRSAVFAPVQNLGLIIIDEEHEGTFKQTEPDPRYHAREVALERMRLNNGLLLLGSATPSLESYYQSEHGEYHLLELPTRASKHNLPEGVVVDLREEFKQGNKSIFSSLLKEYINEALKKKEQIILFLNRRGYSTFVLCRECGQVLDCKNCAISLTYHAYTEELKCHYCSYSEPVPRRCPHCGSSFIRYFGTGTQMVESETKRIWPSIRVDRLDIDTTQNKNSHQSILAKFARGETDLLIGTQMVTKGLDFPNVTVVGIMAADTALNLPDYAAGEKTFQLITQVSGRAGRGLSKGRVVIQTYNPDHYAINYGRKQDYKSFYQQELQIRRIMDYPPFTSLVRILISGFALDRVEKRALEIAQFINQNYNGSFEILGPAAAPIERIKKRFRWQIILRGKNLLLLTEAAQASKLNAGLNREKKEVRIIIDIEPQSIL